MPDAKISQLTNYTTPISTDVLPIVDVSNSVTKKVTVANLLAGSSTSPGGSNTQVQFNNSGNFGGSAYFTWDDNNQHLLVEGNIVNENGLIITSNSSVAVEVGNAGGFDVSTDGGVTIDAGEATSIQGAEVDITSDTSGMFFSSPGGNKYNFTNAAITQSAILDASGIASTDKTFSFPNQTGVIATITSGTSAPGSTPAAVGQIYIKTDTKKVYISTGVSSSSDWTLLN